MVRIASDFSSGLWRLILLAVLIMLTACTDRPWNDPYPPGAAQANTVYSSFDERPKHLDPARSYEATETAILSQIYEPPLQYHYLLRPFRLIPLSARVVPEPQYFDQAGHVLPQDAPAAQIDHSVYRIEIPAGIRFQPHPAFARDAHGRPLYLHLRAEDLAGINRLADFSGVGTRELTAADFVYEIKRLAAPWNHSPIAGVMQEHIRGFAAFSQQMQAVAGEPPLERLQALRNADLSGAEVLDGHVYRIIINGKYPQFRYWLAMNFFAPVPWEADVFYAQPGMVERNIVMDWYPVGTGPFMLSENNPNLRMVLERNPNFHGERYPSAGMPGDAAAGRLADAGKPLPLIDRAVFSLEKESIPRWNKFLQGYYDSSGITSDAFDQAVQIDAEGHALLTERMRRQGIRLQTSVEPSIYYLGFNMLDPVIGGESERAKLLRRAISIAIDYEDFISIFLNGRGLAAQGPIPPGIFGERSGQAGIDPYVYEWRDGRAVRRGIEEARQLMKQAGYPDGIDPATGQALSLNYEAVATGPGDRAQLNWMRKQFAQLGIELVIRSTDYNRFQDKILKGTGQVFMFGWNADYPDPENFLFLLYGPNGKVRYQGENATNYENPEFDRLFEQMRYMDNGPQRQAIIDRMIAIAQADAPWVWGFYPKAFTLYHQWLHNPSTNQMANNTLKYRRVDAPLRAHLQQEWNQPVVWPLWGLAFVLVGLLLPAWWVVRRRERSRAL